MTDEEILWKQFVMTDNKRIDRVVDLYTTFNPHVDLEALKRGGYIQALAEMMEPILNHFDDHAPEVIAIGQSEEWLRSSTVSRPP